jgi:hypothetical protein
MTEADASDLGITPEDRLQYVRLDDAKANMSPRAPKAYWFRLASVTLDNADEIYPFGDQVGVIESWKPTPVWDTVAPDATDRALDRIDAGMPGGSLYTDSRRGNTDRWAGGVLMDLCGVTEGQAAGMLRTWMKNGVLFTKTYHDPQQRKDRVGLCVNATKRPGVVA